MPEGYCASLILGPGKAFEVTHACFTMQFGLATLVGKASDLVDAAGYNGQLYYFPVQRCHGVPVVLQSHPLRLKFWWLFNVFSVPEAGVMYPLSWIHSQPDAVLMSVAEFAVPEMNKILDKRLEKDQDLRDVDLETWLAELDVMMRENPALRGQISSVVPFYARDVFPDGKESPPLLQRYTCWMEDGSAIVLDGDGYQIQQSPICIVPVRHAKHRRMTEFKQVVVHQSCLVSTLQFH